MGYNWIPAFMARQLLGAKPLPEPTLSFDNWAHRDKLRWHKFTFKKFENTVCKISSILSRYQYDKEMPPTANEIPYHIQEPRWVKRRRLFLITVTDQYNWHGNDR